jgi:hypothetical protein
VPRCGATLVAELQYTHPSPGRDAKRFQKGQKQKGKEVEFFSGFSFFAQARILLKKGFPGCRAYLNHHLPETVLPDFPPQARGLPEKCPRRHPQENRVQ